MNYLYCLIFCCALSVAFSSVATDNLKQDYCPRSINLKNYIEQTPDLEGKNFNSKLLTLTIKNQTYVGTISMQTKYPKSLKTFLRGRINGPTLKLTSGPTPLGRKMICEYQWGTSEERLITLKLSTQPPKLIQGKAKQEAKK